MSLSHDARENLGLTTEQFALLLNVPLSTVEEWETDEEENGGALRALFVLLKKKPRECASVLLEHRITTLSVAAPEREPLNALIRKIHGSSVV